MSWVVKLHMLDLSDWDLEEALRVDCHYLKPFLP